MPPDVATAGAVDMWEWAARAFDPDPDERTPWRQMARPEQIEPSGDWLGWLICAGRGFGKTRTGAETVLEKALRYPGCRIALIAATIADARDTMVEGESGLLECIPDRELLGRDRGDAWHRSMGELFLANGSRFKTFSSERPVRLRGPQHHFLWGDEPAYWLDAHKGTAKDTTWSNALFGLRLPAQPGWPADYRPRAVLTTTPRFVPLMKVTEAALARDPQSAGLMQRENIVITRGRTVDNLANLDETYRKDVIEPLQGTTLAKQELDGLLIEDVEGAFLSRDLIDQHRRAVGERPHLVSVAVAIDPATTEKATSDETGIVATGVDNEGRGYVLADRSGVYSPAKWGRAAWDLVLAVGATVLVVEDNQGGDMTQHVLETTWQDFANERRRVGRTVPPPPPIERVHPAKGQGKWVRAQPIKSLAEVGRIHFVYDPEQDLTWLEDQCTSWTGDKDEESPDRADAMVHGLVWQLFPGQRKQKGPKTPVRPGAAMDRRYARAGRR